MAGSACFPIFRRLTQFGIDQMRLGGLEVEVLLDLSHNEHIPIQCDGKMVIAKKIHLDVSVKAAHGKRPDEVLSRLKNASTTSDIFEMRTAIMTGGLEEFRRGERVAVEVSNFDQSVVRLTDTFIPDDLKLAVTACRARTRDAFNALPIATRNSMGMYQRGASNQGFKLTSPKKERKA